MFVLRKNTETASYCLIQKNITIGGIRSRLQLIYTIAKLIAENRITAKNILNLIAVCEQEKELPPITAKEVTEFQFPAGFSHPSLRVAYIIQTIEHYQTVLVQTAHHLQAYESFGATEYPHLYFVTDRVGMLYGRIYFAPMRHEYTSDPFYFITHHKVTPDFFTQEDGVGIVLTYQEEGSFDILTAERLIGEIERSRLIKAPDSVIDN